MLLLLALLLFWLVAFASLVYFGFYWYIMPTVTHNIDCYFDYR